MNLRSSAQPAPFRAHPALAVLDRGLRAWLVFGLVAVLLFPAARGHAYWIGWMPFWLLLWPAMTLALLHRHRWQAPRLPRRRPRRRRRQARRQTAPVAPRRALLAALRLP